MSNGPIPKLGLSMAEAARAIGISQRTLWTLVNCNRVPHRRIGRRIVFPVAELRGWLGQSTPTSGGVGNEK